MKWPLFIALLLACTSGVRPCDLCNYYQNIYPHDGQTTIGLRYRFSRYHVEEQMSHMSLAKIMHGSSAGSEMYNTLEMWGRWYPGSNWYIEFVVPYRENSATEESTERGMGDIVVIGNYHVFESGRDDYEAVKQRLTVGVGLKLKTGGFDQSGDPHLQTGTGTTDFIFSGGYVLKYLRLGLVSNLSFGLNGTNPNGYHFANRMNAAVSGFIQHRMGAVILSPHVGVYAERSGMDTHDGQSVQGTGGSMLLAMTGIDLSLKGWSMMASYQLPVRQSADRPENQYRIVTGLSYSFDTSD